MFTAFQTGISTTTSASAQTSIFTVPSILSGQSVRPTNPSLSQQGRTFIDSTMVGPSSLTGHHTISWDFSYPSWVQRRMGKMQIRQISISLSQQSMAAGACFLRAIEQTISNGGIDERVAWGIPRSFTIAPGIPTTACSFLVLPWPGMIGQTLAIQIHRIVSTIVSAPGKQISSKRGTAF